MEPTGTIVFTTVGMADYGFGIFSAKLPTSFHDNWDYNVHCLTDGISINFSRQIFDEDVYVLERTRSSRIYLNRPQNSKPELIYDGKTVRLTPYANHALNTMDLDP
ncbi:tolB protein-related [Forsythia ovata]|uniref:TolB protein-related n=1 Tax=Forsythia ovata TaxID=205694 RepID=A0ABD1PG89_9LAMI